MFGESNERDSESERGSYKEDLGINRYMEGEEVPYRGFPVVFVSITTI